MSAYIVGKPHIDAMVRLAVRHQVRWYDGKQFHDARVEMDSLGQKLVDQNVKSVEYRYQDSELTKLPGPTNSSWLIPYNYNPFGGRIPTPLEGLKIVSCYEYQSCEDPGWEASEARSFCQALTHHLIDALPGYDAAAGWEWRDDAEHPDYQPIL
jgi:hypothetical protein